MRFSVKLQDIGVHLFKTDFLRKLTVLSTVFILVGSCITSNPKPENCVIQTVTITKIVEGPSYDIVFYDDGTDFYYINRGLQQGLNLDSLNSKVLNKTVTLHLPKLFVGVTSEHIAQMAVGDEIIYTEFN